MIRKLEEQFAEVAARLFRKTDYPVIIAPLRHLFADLLPTLNPAELAEAKRIVKDRQALSWIEQQVGRRWLLGALVGKLARGDPAIALSKWEAARAPTELRRLLQAATRSRLQKATKRDHELIQRSLAAITKENAMALTLAFDARGLPPGLKDKETEYVNKVKNLLQNSFGLAETPENKPTYDAVIGILLLNEQFDFTNDVTFYSAVKTARDETVAKETYLAFPPDSSTDNRVSNTETYKKVTEILEAAGRKTSLYQEFASIARFVISRSKDVPLSDPKITAQIRIAADQYVSGAPVFETLALPPLGSDAQIVKDNVSAVGTIAASYYLEKLRLLDVVDRITELFFNGMLPIGYDAAGRALHDYYWSREDRMRPNERMSVYSRVLGVPGGEVSKEVQPNKEFDAQFNRFIASIAEYDRQRNVSGILTPSSSTTTARPLAFTGELVRKAGNDLGRTASLYGYGGAQFAARMLTSTLQTAITILSLPQILNAYGVNTPYQVIERVGASDFNQSVNVVKYKTMAEAAKRVLDLIASTANVWTNPTSKPLFTENGIAGDLTVDQASVLFTNAQYWIAVNGVTDQQVEKLSQPVESRAGSSLPSFTGAGAAGGADAMAKLQQMVSSGSAPSLDQLRQLLPAGNA